jgi:hypothetical protein
VTETKFQHILAVGLLKELGLDYVRLERQRGGYYRCRAWSVPFVIGNGSPGIIKKGKVRAQR